MYLWRPLSCRIGNSEHVRHASYTNRAGGGAREPDFDVRAGMKHVHAGEPTHNVASHAVLLAREALPIRTGAGPQATCAQTDESTWSSTQPGTLPSLAVCRGAAPGASTWSPR